ncbi:hypothetical protein DFH08DRAFT_812112 [Mycena albidolilacea]|uniref:Uncharacterized protein n=1 Tax=Mycena albidolilacea TaxID=1033008 RepID=A0AAD6ZUG4_9AGAR|nr:hypothetical protein DFH08DRAFT_812112 [Mycena albidolilacea]
MGSSRGERAGKSAARGFGSAGLGLFTAAIGIRLRTVRYRFFMHRHEPASNTNFLGAVDSPEPQDGFTDGKIGLPAVSRHGFCHVTAGNWTKLTAVTLSRAVPYYGRNFTTYGEKPYAGSRPLEAPNKRHFLGAFGPMINFSRMRKFLITSGRHARTFLSSTTTTLNSRDVPNAPPTQARLSNHTSLQAGSSFPCSAGASSLVLNPQYFNASIFEPPKECILQATASLVHFPSSPLHIPHFTRNQQTWQSQSHFKGGGDPNGSNDDKLSNALNSNNMHA